MKRSAGILGLLVSLFAAPGVVAYLLYQHPQWLNTRTNHGHLLKPPPRLDQLPHTNKWQLLYWTPERCDLFCMQRMDDLAKLRLALGRRLYEVDLVLASQAPRSDLPTNAETLLAEVDGHWAQLSPKTTEILGAMPAIYLVDPQRYVILAYTNDQTLKDIFQDLQKMVHDK